MAEVLLRQLRPDLQAASAGVAASDAATASQTAKEAFQRLGMDLSQHRARQIRAEALSWADQVVCMTLGHHEHLKKLFPESAAKLFVLRPLAGLGGNPDVADPYGGDLESYLLCAQDLKQALELAFGETSRQLS